MGRIEWEMIVIGLGQFTLWIATWVLVIVGTIPLYVGFLLALFTACNAYLPSHAGQHSHLSGGKKNLQWLDYWIGQISLIQHTQSHEILKATHLKHHAHTNDPDNDPDFFHGNAKNWWEAAVSANVAYNNDGPAMKVISKHIEDDPKFKNLLKDSIYPPGFKRLHCQIRTRHAHCPRPPSCDRQLASATVRSPLRLKSSRAGAHWLPEARRWVSLYPPRADHLF